MRTLLSLYGTRPEAIKMAPLIEQLERHPNFDSKVAVTGQHREMLDQVNELFGITPQYDLDIMLPGATLHTIAQRVLGAIGPVFDAVSPDAVIVQGDTTSAFIGGLAAFYAGIPVVHLEAGLRTGQLSNPFPEEGNRRLLAAVASLHLAPTAGSKANLLREGVEQSRIAVTGNTVIDALHSVVDRPLPRSSAVRPFLQKDGRLVLVTTHRRESWGEPMRESMSAVRSLSRRYPEDHFLVPMHRNPLVREVVEAVLLDCPNVNLCEPLGYHDFAHAMNRSTLIVTDSGGVQEEAPSLGKPVLVTRDTTERPEAVEAGTVRLVGTDRELIEHQAQMLLDDATEYDVMAKAVNPYGDGLAAQRATSAIAAHFGLGPRQPDFEPRNSTASA